MPFLSSQAALLDTLFPGFSIFSNALDKYLKLDVTLYVPWLLAIAVLVVAWQHASEYLWGLLETYFMSTADIRVDDEMYNWLFAWVAAQRFAQESRRFVANTNLSSRAWYLMRSLDDSEDEDESAPGLEIDNSQITDLASWITQCRNPGAKAVHYTPSFGTHYFWYRNRLLLFSRNQDTRNNTCGTVSEREQISISCFGRDPKVLKELLTECRDSFLNRDKNHTLIYRGTTKSGSTDATWTRCMTRVSRPFPTVVLDEAVKQSLLDDMTDYLHPLTRRWYCNRGIPYRRGYLFHGPPGTGKSSLSFAVAGFFKLKIYIVSLNSLSMNEENLNSLFSELPMRCVVLLEDIDTAGLTHTRGEPETEPEVPSPTAATAAANPTAGKISLSALLNVIDGVASQEGRILIMTTNHIEKLDKALIRPGRVDMTIKFDLANKQMVGAIFRTIFATLEGELSSPIPDVEDETRSKLLTEKASSTSAQKRAISPKTSIDGEVATIGKRAAEQNIYALADSFAAIIPTHTLSPAEVQGYLLKHKRDPEEAVANAADWVKTVLAEREKEDERQDSAVK